jgi:hypothetical protein
MTTNLSFIKHHPVIAAFAAGLIGLLVLIGAFCLCRTELSITRLNFFAH